MPFSPAHPMLSAGMQEGTQVLAASRAQGVGGSRAGTTEPATSSLSLRGSRGSLAPHLAPGLPAGPQPHHEPKLGSHGRRDAGIQQGSPSTEAQQEQQTTGCTATLQQSQHLFPIFFIQRKSTAVIPAEQCLPATALPRQERGTAALVGEDRQPLACLLPGKRELLGFISFIFPFRSRACSQPWLFPSLQKRMNISPPLQNRRSCHFTY